MKNLLCGVNHNIIKVILMAGERSYFSKDNVVTCHHVYKSIWMPGISKEHSVEKEPGNLHDNFAVSMEKNDYTVGHVPRSLSKVTWFFLTQGGTVTCWNTMAPAHSARHASSDYSRTSVYYCTGLVTLVLKRDQASKRHGGYLRQYGTCTRLHTVQRSIGSIHTLINRILLGNIFSWGVLKFCQ